MEEKIDEKNKNSSKEKLSYKKDLWMYFDSIKDKFYYERNKAKALLYIISQKNDLYYEYSENLKYLFNQYINEFVAHDEEFDIKNNEKENNTLNKAIKSFINSLKYESELFLNHAKDIDENIVKPLEGIIMNQCEINNEFSVLMKSYEKDFMNTFKLLEEKQINFYQGGRSVESAINKLEILKNQIKNENNEEKNENNDKENQEDIDDKLEQEENQKEMLEKMDEILEQNKISSKQLQKDYQDYIIIANSEREKYIRLSESLYDKVQNLDEEFIKNMKINLILLTGKQLDVIEKMKNNILSTLQISKEIDIEKEINIFIKSKTIKFCLPSKFEYIDYNPSLILPNMKCYTNTLESEISSKIIECLNETFKYEQSEESLKQKENINFVNNTVDDIWNGNDFDKNRLELLFKEHIYRLTFLKLLNQYRVEGIFLLQNFSFKNFCISFSLILDKSILEEDYECIKIVMILSQTFYLQSDKKILLQSSITLNSIWQSEKFWEKMIEYSINDEINNSKEFKVFLEEDSETRKKRAESAVISNLITFLFNMKLFGYSETKSKVVIDKFIKKYNIDGNSVYETNISMKDLQDDFLTASVSDIINNDIKENNDINIKSEECIILDKDINNDNIIDNNKINMSLNDSDNNMNMNNNEINNNTNNEIKDEITNNIEMKNNI